MFVDDKSFDHSLQCLLTDMRIDNGDILAAAEAFTTENFLGNCVYSSVGSDDLVLLLH